MSVPGLVRGAALHKFCVQRRVLLSEKGQDTAAAAAAADDTEAAWILLGLFPASQAVCSLLASLPGDCGNLAICNPQRPLTQQKSGVHLERRQPNLHLQKPGSCVSLLPAKRGRTRRGPKPRPCCGAARLHVSFHDKHFHRWSRTLSIYSSDSPAAVFIGAEVEGK